MAKSKSQEREKKIMFLFFSRQKEARKIPLVQGLPKYGPQR